MESSGSDKYVSALRAQELAGAYVETFALTEIGLFVDKSLKMVDSIAGRRSGH